MFLMKTEVNDIKEQKIHIFKVATVKKSKAYVSGLI